MANDNYINYQIALVPENSELIDKMNKLTLGADYTKAAKTTTAKEKPEKKEKPAKSDGTTADQFKDAAKVAKKEHGDEFAMQVLKDAGVEVGASLGRSIGKVDSSDYDAIIKSWQSGPTVKDDDLDDDGFGDDDDTPVIDADAVKIALKAYAKETGREEAKAIMNDNGAKALSNVDDCTQAQLAAMMKALV